jgi:glycosyltransferase involved in cell wall biosynthesis
MNIALVVSYLSDRFGGPVAAVKHLGRVLGRKGHTISYWATTDDHDGLETSSTEGAHIYNVDWLHSWRYSRGFAPGLSAAMSSVDLVELNEFWLYPIYAGSRAARRADVPYILRPAGSLQSWALNRTPVKRLKKALYLSLVGNSLMKNAACISVASTYEAENIQRLGYSGPITVIHNGLNLIQFEGVDESEAEVHWPILRDRPVVLFMSRLSAEKGLDLLIPAWAELLSSAAYGEAILIIAGPDYRGYRKLVEGLIEKYAVQKSVFLVGMVQGRPKASLLRRADVFVLPSYSENFGIVVGEALAVGTPVITTTGTPWEQLSRIDAGRWIAPTKTELVEVLREMLSMSAAQRREMGRRGMHFVRSEYTWERAGCSFLHVCHCILEGKAIPLHPNSEPERPSETSVHIAGERHSNSVPTLWRG